MEQQPFEVDIGNLIQVLAESLYSDPRVALRELLANARDSLLRRWGVARARNGHIRVGWPTAGVLRIADNGAGMDRAEIREGLARVAGSMTRVVRRQWGESEEWARWLGGWFGLGFFSSFMLAYGVEVRTRQPNGQAYLWRVPAGLPRLPGGLWSQRAGRAKARKSASSSRGTSAMNSVIPWRSNAC